MKSRHRMIGFVGVLAFVLAACAGNDQVMTEQETSINDLRRQVESLRAQVTAKDQEIQKLSARASSAKTMETQVSALEERLRGMQDILLAKDEQVAKLEVQLEEMKRKAAKPAVKKAKPDAAVKPPASPKAPTPAKPEASAKPEVPPKAESPAKAAPPTTAKDRGNQ
jgi:septal ring factor EnvC (AmiA/AmiB activator)